MWSSDYPHNESTFGYSEKSLASVVEAVGPGERRQDRQRKHQEVPGRLMTTFATADAVRPRNSGPARPGTHVPRERRPAAVGDGGQRRRRTDPARQRQRGVRHGRQLAAARRRACLTSNGRSRSCWPTTSIRTCSCRSARARRRSREIPADHLHPPLYLEFDEGVDHFARVVAELIPPGATVAVDELTGAMRRAADRLFPADRPSDAAPVVGAAKLVKTPDQIACIRRACRITEEAVVDVQKALAPGCPSDRSVGSSSCGAPSSSARPRTCSRPSGR